jgi:hypothetical protein
MSAFLYFSSEIIKELIGKGRNRKDSTQEASRLWKEMTTEDKKKWLDLEEGDKERYEVDKLVIKLGRLLRSKKISISDLIS